MDDHPYEFPVTVWSGGTEVRVQFSTYRYTNNPSVRRPKKFEPPPKEEPTPLKTMPTLEAKSDEKKDVVPKEKNVNLQA